MAIKKIKFHGNEIISQGEIKFTNSNIATVVGMNGSGKSILMRHNRI